MYFAHSNKRKTYKSLPSILAINLFIVIYKKKKLNQDKTIGLNHLIPKLIFRIRLTDDESKNNTLYTLITEEST
jgi:hypothetical protein